MSTNSFNTNTIVKTLILVVVMSLAGGCGGGGSSGGTAEDQVNTDPGSVSNDDPKVETPPSDTTQSLIIEGSANKGLIVNGIVQAYLIENQAGVMSISSTPYGAPTRTDASGKFKLSLPPTISSNSLVVDITADNKSMMTCDVVAGCKHNDLGTTTKFGDKFGLSAGFSMRGVVTSPKKTLSNVIRITPMSHLALARSAYLQGGMTNTNITQSYAYVEGIFGLDAGSLQLETPDLTNLSLYRNLSKAQLEVAIVSASFLALANTPDWSGIDEVINHAAQNMASSGLLEETNLDSVPDVVLKDLFYESAKLAQDLSSTSISSAQTTSLNKIYAEANLAYEKLSTPQQVVDPVVITAQPSSATVSEHSAVSFIVTATGGGELGYQWRKDGSAISGANQANYNLTDVSLSATGVYDVIVSNSVGSVASLSALLTVNAAEIVIPVNAAPVAVNDVAVTAEDSPVIINVLANDADSNGDSLNVSSVSATHGTATINSTNTITFVPVNNFNGAAAISYSISDGKGGSASATVAVTVTAVNDNPVAVSDTASTTEDISIKISVLANDSDLDGDTLSVASAAVNSGSVAINSDYTLTFVPAANSSGLSTISYNISDGKGGSAAATVAVTVTAVNDNPAAVSDSATTAEDSSVNINVLANDTDADNDVLSISLASAVNGSVTIVSKNTLTFTPTANFNGVSAITYTVVDGQGGSAQANVTISVTPVNDLPVALDEAMTIAEDTWITISALSNDSDLDGDVLTVTGAVANSGAVVINSGKTLTYTPVANFNGLASINYTISDGKGGSASAVANVTVTAVNDQPVAKNDSATTDQNKAVIINALTNDIDVDGDSLIITAATAANGSVVIDTQGLISYTPTSNFSGATTLSYTVSDGKGGVATAQVAVTVNAVSTVAKVELTWDIPLARENGDSLALYEINGYMIAYGTSPDQLTSTVFVSGGLIGSYVLESLTKGTYYFAIATVDTDDVQGAYSGTVMINVM